MSEKLINARKCCPFCGSGEIIPTELPAQISPTGAPVFTNGCNGCGASTGGYPTKLEADQAWDKRTKENFDA